MVILAALLFSGCKKSNKEQNTTPDPVEVQSYSTGKISTLYLYLDDVYKNLPFRDSLHLYLDQPYLLVPRPQARFDISEKSFSAFNFANNMKNANNLFVVHTSEESDLLNFTRQLIGEEKIEEALSGKNMALLRVKDVYSQPQQLFFLLSKVYPNVNDVTIKDELKQHVSSIYDEATKIDNQRLVSTFARDRNRSLEKVVADKFGANIWLPDSYQLVDSTSNFIWIIRESIDLYSNIVLYKKPADETGNLAEKVIPLRDEWGVKITTDVDGSRMSTLTNRKPFPVQRELVIDSVDVYETRGLWQMKNDHLGGGFLNYTWRNGEGNIITMDGSVYYTDEDKRRKMRDIDAIFSTLSF